MFDHDLIGTDDFIGGATIELSQIRKLGREIVKDEWLPLRPKKSKASYAAGSLGQVEVRLTFTPSNAPASEDEDSEEEKHEKGLGWPALITALRDTIPCLICELEPVFVVKKRVYNILHFTNPIESIVVLLTTAWAAWNEALFPVLFLFVGIYMLINQIRQPKFETSIGMPKKEASRRMKQVRVWRCVC